MLDTYHIKRFLERQKYRYRYAPWYVHFRRRSLFSRQQRKAFENLAQKVSTFKRSRLLAVGNEGLIYEGRYDPDLESRYLLKVSLNKNDRARWFDEVQERLADESPEWLCRIAEYDLAGDRKTWYQVQEFVEGLMISRYLMLTPDRQRSTADPARLVADLIEQAIVMRRLRILAPNVDEENLILSPEGMLRRIDLDPYRVIPEASGEMPRHDFRRLFRVARKILSPHIPALRQRDGVSSESMDVFLERLANSSVCTYGDPRKKRRGKEVRFGEDACFYDLEEPLDFVKKLVKPVEYVL